MNENNPSDTPVKNRGKIIARLITLIVFLPLLSLIISVLALRWIDPPVTSFVLRADWETLEMERYNLRDYWVKGDDIPEHMKWAVVASEDQLFWEHRGFDMESIREAWDDRQAGRRTRGASTISQQVAKNLFLSPAHSFLRKGVEAGITIFIELFWPKERIIEVYLNIAEFGPGIYGIGRAADTFWSMPGSSIDADRAARLAAVLPSPRRMRVEPPSPYAYERSRWILRQMTQLTGNRYIRPAPDEPTDIEGPGAEDIDPFLLQTERDLDELLRMPDDSVLIEPDTTGN